MLVALALVPPALLGFQLISISQRGIQSAVLELQTKLAEKLAEKIDLSLSTTNDKLSFALASLQKPMEWPDKQALLQSLIETDPSIDEISMVAADGRELLKVYNPDLSSARPLLNRSKEPAFAEFLAARRKTTRLVAGQDAPILVIYQPMTARLAARVEVSLRTLAGSISAERVGGTGFPVVVDSGGHPIIFPQELLDRAQVEGFPRWPIVSAALQSETVGSSDFSAGGRAYVGGYAPVSSLQGAVVILQPRDEAYSAAARMRRTAVATLILLAGLCLLAATLLARRLTQPLLALARAAESVARGDFSARVSLSTHDELQDLAETFNRMADKLRVYSELQVDRIIAEQKKTEAILFSITDGIVMLDDHGKVQLANRRALEMLGRDAALTVEGKPAVELAPSGPLREAMAALVANPKWDLLRDLDLSTEDAPRHLRLASRPVMTPQGATVGVLLALRDITLERELDKMKEQFLHYVTHDLRNPLGSAMGFLDIMLRGSAGVLNAEQHSIVSSIKRSCMRLMGMVNNILDIAKMESGRIRLQLRPSSVAGVAGRSIAILESLAKAKRIELELSAAEEFTIDCDSDLIERVFTNLIGNAIKYTPENGKITVSIVDAETSLKCCVADTGEGIPKDYLERIFEKFEQVQGSRRGGTGLGLTIARFFVESHLGRIWVESELGRGSQFYFTLPKSLVLDADGKTSLGAVAA